MGSTILFPLLFFEEFYNEKVIEQYFIDELDNADLNFIALTDCRMIKFIERDEFGEYVENEMSPNKLLLPLLKSELTNSKTHLQNYYLENEINIANKYFVIQLNSINRLFSKNKMLIVKFPILAKPLILLFYFIKEKFPSESIDKIDLMYEDFIISESLLFKFKSTDEQIEIIFGFMQRQNEKRELILNEADFSTLKGYIQILIDEEKVPEISQKLHPKISNDLLRFSFWVLHHELYTTKRIRTYFYYFLKSAFENFNHSELESIKKQFGTRSRVKKDHFLPQIISNYL